MSERFYVNCELRPGAVHFQGAEAHHLAVVCRLRAGDAVCLFNGDGHQYPARIEEVTRREVALEVFAVESPEPRVALSSGYRRAAAARRPRPVSPGKADRTRASRRSRLCGRRAAWSIPAKRSWTSCSVTSSRRASSAAAMSFWKCGRWWNGRSSAARWNCRSAGFSLIPAARASTIEPRTHQEATWWRRSVLKADSRTRKLPSPWTRAGTC